MSYDSRRFCRGARIHKGLVARFVCWFHISYRGVMEACGK